MSVLLLKIIAALSAFFYGITFLSLIFAKKSGKKYYTNCLWAVAILLNLAIVLNNFFENGYVPFVSMYQVLTFLALTFAIVYLYMRFARDGLFMKPYFVVLQTIIMIGVFCMDQNSKWAFPPALQSPFFIPHVFSYMLSYTMTAAAAVICVTGMIKKDESLDRGVYELCITAFPFMLCGMFLGALWANECWGEYWQWDAKENWSLVTLFSLTVYFHFRRDKKLSRYARYFVILSFVFLVITMFFVNFMGGNSNHAYN